MSVVPPPMSMIMFPPALSMGRPAPIAAAIGSSMGKARLAPASPAAWMTARRSTPVTPEGTDSTIWGLKSGLLPAMRRRICESMRWVRV